MLMKITPGCEPLQIVRACIAPENLPTFDLLVGSISLPIEQPNLGLFIQKLASCFLTYVQEIPNQRSEFQALVTQVAAVSESVSSQLKAISIWQPQGQMKSRAGVYPEVSLLEVLWDEQTPLRLALGADVALALLNQSKLNTNYCNQIRKDAKKYGRPEGADQRDPCDLAELQFGRAWLPRFLKIDREIRRRVELSDPKNPPSSQRPAAKHRMDLLARLKWRFDYSNPKHRQAGFDDSHLQLEQYCRATTQARKSLEQGEKKALLKIAAILTGFPADTVFWVPLISTLHPLHIVGINVERGSMCLELKYLFPFMKRPSNESAHLFMESGDMLEIPLPCFFAEHLRTLTRENINAQYLGDLADWTVLSSRDQLVTNESCKLNSSLARASKSAGPITIQTGATRLLAAAITWDFSLIGSARMYYARLTGAEIFSACNAYFHQVGWGAPTMAADDIKAAGSHCTLTDHGAAALFSFLANRVNTARPGRHAGFARLSNYHQHYTRYTVALLSFCLGLRSVRAYHLLSRDLINGQTSIVVHDKQGGERLMAQSAHLNQLALEQVTQYLAHCSALVRRLSVTDSPHASSLTAALQKSLSGEGFLFHTQSKSGAIRPVGTHFVWDEFPPQLRVPGNIGRHFWQNKFRLEGLLSRDIDRWMRHRVVGLENNTTSQVTSNLTAFQRIDRVQTSVLTHMGITVISGLRRAGK